MDGCVVEWTEITLRNGWVGGQGEWWMFAYVDGRMKYRLAVRLMEK